MKIKTIETDYSLPEQSQEEKNEIFRKKINEIIEYIKNE